MPHEPLAEAQEALERQSATAEILQLIASSPSDVQPIFDAIVKSAANLFGPCGATITTLKDGKLSFPFRIGGTIDNPVFSKGK